MRVFKNIILFFTFSIVGCQNQDRTIKDYQYSSQKCLSNMIDEQCLENGSYEFDIIRIKKFDYKSNKIKMFKLEDFHDEIKKTFKIINQNELNPLLADATISFCTYKSASSFGEWNKIETLIKSLSLNNSKTLFLLHDGYVIEFYKNKIYKNLIIDLNDTNSLSFKPSILKLDSLMNTVQGK